MLEHTSKIYFYPPRYIDQGRNPQLYTKECLERALAKNEQVKGKIDTMTVRQQSINLFYIHLKPNILSSTMYTDRALTSCLNEQSIFISLQKFKSLLISELGKVFPEEMAKYKAIHGDDPPS